MECDVCGKAGNSGHPMHCITCARSHLEQPRIELARTLIDRDGVAKHVTAVIKGSEDKSSQHVSLTDSKGGLLVDRQECTNNLNWQRTKAETEQIQDRIRTITEQSERLREQTEAVRKQLETRRAANAQLKSDLSSATYGVESRRANDLDKVQQVIKRTEYKAEKLHHETIQLRMQLCTTAARLAGLKATKRRNKDGQTKEVFNIGPGTRLRVYDLRDLNDAPPDHLSASLAAIAQLLIRVAAYLGIRLPAEITLPHNDYPQPTIFSPTSSYRGRKVPFPGSTPSHSSSTSPEASRTLEARVHLPKPRALYIDRPLGHLSAEDPPAYASFMEGVSLMAYNVAWLCRTQGMKGSLETWEEICPIGRNLHRLLVAQETYSQQRPENSLDPDITATRPAAEAAFRKTPVTFGQLSHATSHSFMHLAGNAHYLSGWTITPTKIVDELKAYLLAEQQAQEWDVLNQKEWEDMEKLIAEDPIVVGEGGRKNAESSDGHSVVTMSTRTGRSSPLREVLASVAEQPGRKGWTKVKSRSSNAE